MLELCVQVNMGFSPSRISFILHLSKDYLASQPNPWSRKILHIPHNLLQPIPIPTANNNSINGWIKQLWQTAHSQSSGPQARHFKHFSWQSFKNLKQYFLSYPVASVNVLSRGAKRIGKCLTYFEWAGSQSKNICWPYIFFPWHKWQDKRLYLFTLFLLKIFSLNIVSIPHCPSTHIN